MYETSYSSFRGGLPGCPSDVMQRGLSWTNRQTCASWTCSNRQRTTAALRPTGRSSSECCGAIAGSVGQSNGVDPPMEIHPSERLQFYVLRRTRSLSDAYSTWQLEDRARECSAGRVG